MGVKYKKSKTTNKALDLTIILSQRMKAGERGIAQKTR